MNESWDVIIVGAGIGGLTAASLLAKENLRVLVLDKNPHIGGTAYVYRRKDFFFPMGPLGFGSSRLVGKILEDIGQGGDFRLRPVKYLIRAFDLEVPISLPFAELIDDLSKTFPGRRKNFERFFLDMEKISAALQSPDLNKNSDLLEWASATPASKYLEELEEDWRLRRILGSIGTSEPYAALTLLAAMWNLISKEGISYPEGGMRSLCERLANAFTEREEGIRGEADDHKPVGSGEIRINTEVAGIRVDRGKIAGVALKDGSRIDAAAVVSNADFKTTFLGLLSPKEIPEELFDAISNAKQTMSNIQVCLGLDKERIDVGAFKEFRRLIYRGGGNVLPGAPPDWKEARIDPESIARQELEISLLSADDPALAPGGGAVIVIRTEADFGHFARFRPAPRRRSPDYRDYKELLGSGLIGEAEKIIPGLSGAILVKDIATPLTYAERGGRSDGAVAGWSWDYEDSRDYVPRELVLTPIGGLYMAGYQAFSSLFMGGVPTAMESGVRAAKAVLKGSDPVSKILIPGNRFG
jgi:phytoene dehydrogenase-like protein